MKTLFILIISLFCCFFSFESVAAQEDRAFLESFRQTVKFNQSRFKDINLVYPGDTVMVVGKGITPIAILPRDSMPGYHDCVWYAVKRTQRLNIASPVSSINYVGNEKSKRFNLSDFIKENLALIITSLLAGIFLLLLALLIIAALRRPVIINNNLSCQHHCQAMPETLAAPISTTT